MSLNADGRSIKTGGDCATERREFHVMASATGNDRGPTVDSWSDWTWSWYDADE